MVMGTRSGDVDPAVLQYVMNIEGLSIDEMLNILNKKSGLLGISGVSSDMPRHHQGGRGGQRAAKLAIRMLCYRLRKYIGAYAAAMEGVDAIAFTGGIGENDSQVRQEVLSKLSFLGIELDEEGQRRPPAATASSPPRTARSRCWWFPPTRSLPSPGTPRPCANKAQRQGTPAGRRLRKEAFVPCGKS